MSDESFRDRVTTRVRRSEQARAYVTLTDGWWRARILDRRGRIVHEDAIGAGKAGSSDRDERLAHLLADVPDDVAAVRAVERMGHRLKEWDWLVDQVKS